MENKRKNIYVTIFVITTVIASCFAVYFAIEANNINPQNITLGKVGSVATDDVKTSETKVEIKEVEKVVEKYTYPNFDASKGINTDKESTYSFSLSEEKLGTTCTLNSDKKSVSVSFNPNIIKMYYGIDVSSSFIEINNFSGEVVDIYADNLGHQAAGSEVFLFLMKDGSVEYLPVKKAVESNNVKSYGKIPGIENIVKLGTISVAHNQGGGYGAPCAIKADGSFYDLSNALISTGNF